MLTLRELPHLHQLASMLPGHSSSSFFISAGMTQGAFPHEMHFFAACTFFSVEAFGVSKSALPLIPFVTVGFTKPQSHKRRSYDGPFAPTARCWIWFSRRSPNLMRADLSLISICWGGPQRYPIDLQCFCKTPANVQYVDGRDLRFQVPILPFAAVIYFVFALYLTFLMASSFGVKRAHNDEVPPVTWEPLVQFWTLAMCANCILQVVRVVHVAVAT